MLGDKGGDDPTSTRRCIRELSAIPSSKSSSSSSPAPALPSHTGISPLLRPPPLPMLMLLSLPPPPPPYCLSFTGVFRPDCCLEGALEGLLDMSRSSPIPLSFTQGPQPQLKIKGMPGWSCECEIAAQSAFPSPGGKWEIKANSAAAEPCPFRSLFFPAPPPKWLHADGSPKLRTAPSVGIAAGKPAAVISCTTTDGPSQAECVGIIGWCVFGGCSHLSVVPAEFVGRKGRQADPKPVQQTQQGPSFRRAEWGMGATVRGAGWSGVALAAWR